MAQYPRLERLARRNGVICFPPPDTTAEAVAEAVAERVGYAGVLTAQRQDRGVVAYAEKEEMVASLATTGITIRDVFVQCTSLSTPATRVLISGASPIPERYGTEAGPPALWDGGIECDDAAAQDKEPEAGARNVPTAPNVYHTQG